jgi:lysophospholipase L1-like esterase
MQKFMIPAALLVGSTLFAVGALEAGLRSVGWRTLRINPDQLHFWRHDPVLGWAHRPGQQGVFATEQFRTHVRINSRGLRGRELAYERPRDTKRILVLGDSFAWGFGVEECERFSELLETALGVEVINSGVSGYSTDQKLLWLRNEGIRYDFDLVLGVFPGNDHYDNHLARNYFVYDKPYFELAGDTLSLRGVPVRRPGRHLLLERYLRQKLVVANRLSRGLRTAYARSLRSSDRMLAFHTNVLRWPAPPWTHWQNDASDPFALMRTIVQEIRDVSAERNAEFVMVSTPRYWIGDEFAGGSYDELIASIRSAGIHVLDVESHAGFHGASMVIPNDGHWNAAGHAFVARELQRFIEEHGLLDHVSGEDRQSGCVQTDAVGTL